MISVRQEIRQMTKYNIYLKKVPKDMNYRVENIVKWSSKSFSIDKNKSISMVILTPPSDWTKLPHSINYYVIGYYRTSYSIIRHVAKHLSEMYSEMLIIPRVCPIRENTIDDHLAYKTQFIKSIQYKGLLIYDKEEEYVSQG